MDQPSKLHSSFQAVLEATLGDNYCNSDSSDFFIRTRQEHDLVVNAEQHGMLGIQNYTAGRIDTRIKRGTLFGQLAHGLNFGSQDYLSLSTHPALAEAVTATAAKHGVHSGGTAAFAGDSVEARKLEAEIAEFTQYETSTLFPIGWAAGYGVITSLVRSDDHVILDFLAHACLQEGANAATKNVHRTPHLSIEGVEKRLKRIRRDAPRAGILVITESLFSMDSDVPSIARLQRLCHEYGARLLVDVAHDLGAIAVDGGGFLEIQGMVGKCDILIGSFSKSFASIGGFIACNEPGIKTRLRIGCGPSTFTNAMTPLQVAVIRKSLEIIRSNEGRAKRKRLMSNILLMRDLLEQNGFLVLGEPSAIVPIVIGDYRQIRLATKFLAESNCFVNCVEYPAVARKKSRWRLQIMANHSHDDIRNFVTLLKNANNKAVYFLEKKSR